ncbi:hypothetical protein C8J57DRAFT_1249014 [Mycena rebaudengoi]|nr:hypothetical protein C8J57DRAFT_1249014 [Mycena rebaudengoi]
MLIEETTNISKTAITPIGVAPPPTSSKRCFSIQLFVPKVMGQNAGTKNKSLALQKWQEIFSPSGEFVYSKGNSVDLEASSTDGVDSSGGSSSPTMNPRATMHSRFFTYALSVGGRHSCTRFVRIAISLAQLCDLIHEKYTGNILVNILADILAYILALQLKLATDQNPASGIVLCPQACSPWRQAPHGIAAGRRLKAIDSDSYTFTAAIPSANLALISASYDHTNRHLNYKSEQYIQQTFWYESLLPERNEGMSCIPHRLRRVIHTVVHRNRMCRRIGGQEYPGGSSKLSTYRPYLLSGGTRTANLFKQNKLKTSTFTDGLLSRPGHARPFKLRTQGASKLSSNVSSRHDPVSQPLQVNSPIPMLPIALTPQYLLMYILWPQPNVDDDSVTGSTCKSSLSTLAVSHIKPKDSVGSLADIRGSVWIVGYKLCGRQIHRIGPPTCVDFVRMCRPQQLVATDPHMSTASVITCDVGASAPALLH